MDYILLQENEKHEQIANFILAQEKDHHSHTGNLRRFKKILVAIPDCPFKDRIQKLHDDTMDRIMEVEAIIDATISDSEFPKVEHLTAALDRLEAKRKQNAR